MNPLLPAPVRNDSRPQRAEPPPRKLRSACLCAVLVRTLNAHTAPWHRPVKRNPRWPETAPSDTGAVRGAVLQSGARRTRHTSYRRSSPHDGLQMIARNAMPTADSQARECHAKASLYVSLPVGTNPAGSRIVFTNSQRDPPRTRTWNLRLRGPTPYPLGQRAACLRNAGRAAP